MILDSKFMKITIGKTIIFLSLFLFAKPVFAAEFFATVPNPVLELGEFTQVNFFLDTQSVELNALEGYVVYPTELLEIKEIIYGNSVINYWIEKPHNIESGKIFFSGITPGGFNENSALLLSATFQTKNIGKADINFEKIKALKNNGYGTAVKASTKTLSLKIQPELQGKNLENVYKTLDKIPPEIFEPLILEDSSVALGKKILIFDTLDKDSGVAQYEVLEERILNLFGFEIKIGRWQPAQSPYFLKDQNLKSNIYVKAIDRAGNFYVASVLLAKSSHWYTNFNFWVIIIIVLLLLYLFGRVYVHYRKKNKSR